MRRNNDDNLPSTSGRQPYRGRIPRDTKHVYNYYSNETNKEMDLDEFDYYANGDVDPDNVDHYSPDRENKPSNILSIKRIPNSIPFKDVQNTIQALCLDVFGKSFPNKPIIKIDELLKNSDRWNASIEFDSIEQAVKFYKIYSVIALMSDTSESKVYPLNLKYAPDNTKDWIRGSDGMGNKIPINVSITTARRDNSNGPKFQNNGSKDKGNINSPSQFLLLRNLKKKTTEENLFNCLLNKENLKFERLLLIKDKLTNISLGFAFIEFSSTESAIKTYEKYNNNKEKKLTIDSSYISVSFIHLGVFIPVMDNIIVDGFWNSNTTTYLQYWDSNAIVIEYPIPDNNEEEKNMNNEINAPGKKKRKRKFKEKETEKELPKQLQTWNSKQNELRHSSFQTLPIHDVNNHSDKNKQSFSDLHKLICILCYRKFQNLDELKEHEMYSDYHKYRLHNFEESPQTMENQEIKILTGIINK